MPCAIALSPRRCALLLPALLLSAPSQAARPMATDDARIVDAKACQVESWVRRNRHSTEFWALPACNPTGGAELTLGGAHQGGSAEDGPARNLGVMQAKTLLKPLETNGWGVGLSVGLVERLRTPRSGDPYLNLPMSWSLRDDHLFLHANLGWLREHERASQRHRLTWGLATEAQLHQRAWLIAETFGQQSGKPSFQFGLRLWLIPDRVQVDTTYGSRFGNHRDERWISIGLRLLTPAFLP
jgi:hypothetical protein